MEDSATPLTRQKSRQKRIAIIRFVSSFVIGAVIFLTTNNTIAGAVLPSIHAAWSPLRTGWWMLRVLTLGPLLALTSYYRLSSRIIASHPAECWRS